VLVCGVQSHRSFFSAAVFGGEQLLYPCFSCCLEFPVRHFCFVRILLLVVIWDSGRKYFDGKFTAPIHRLWPPFSVLQIASLASTWRCMRSGAGTTTAWGGQYCGAAPGHAHGIVFWKGHARGIVFWRAERIYTTSSLCLAAVSSAKRRQTSLRNADEVTTRV
jgi:hypothetical protein